YNVGILIFLVILGIMVQMMNRTGGSAAFGTWASERIKTREGAQLSTIALGVLIFIDDYFNCLTVGSVMRPVTDKHNVSRAKLAYLIDATAAPVCIIAPISSWAAAVSGFVEGENGLSLFIKAIPFNYYALLTIAMMIMIVLMHADYGPMYAHEYNAVENNDIFSEGERPASEEIEKPATTEGKVADMIFPIVSLVACCVVGMIYTGGFFSGESFVNSFANSDASIGLVLGSSVALVLTIIYYMIRRILPFNTMMECIPEGFKQMVSPILILTFAWSLKSMTDSLGAKQFVAGIVENSASSFLVFLPVIVFLVAVGLSFATGTSWGTFGILIPIVVSCFQGTDPNMMIIAISACMAGSVCGDHCSPISDTTIMSSAGAQCNHINHVSTQLPYALACAAISAITYLISSGIEKATDSLMVSACVSLPIGLILVFLFLVAMKSGSEGRKSRMEAINR
ncbi:MAG: Na+/H+ antiporter NhaC family protein, partial [Lachnospiraceae bacterium]|nr:Na+/H+ antiporter NhaC family protein [Lachnospiraceae bacterium]